MDTLYGKSPTDARHLRGIPTGVHDPSDRRNCLRSEGSNCRACDTPRSEWRSQVHVPGQVALVQVDVAHDHHVGGVAEDSPQALDLTTLAQVLGRVGVPELVCPNPEADAVADTGE